MAHKILSHPFSHLTTTFLVAFGVFVSIYPHIFPQLSWVVNYAVQLMLLYLLGGMAFLFFRQPRLTFICFGGCLVLCFFLKVSIKSNSIDRWRNSMLEQHKPMAEQEQLNLKVAHFNLSNTTSAAEMSAAMQATEADVLSIHEVTPGWSQWLEDSLAASYPYRHTMVDSGIFGMAIYSRYKFESVDTFYHDDIPNLRACIKKEGMDICLVSVHTEPALNEYSLRKLEGHLETLTGQVNRMQDMPLIVLGDFNSVAWSKELQGFMNKSGLLESRLGFMDRQHSFMGVPVDHIFYSPRLGCTDFDSFGDKGGGHLGIMATFLINPLATHAKKTAQ